MAFRNYPRIGLVEKKPRNATAQCPCGQVGKYRVEIQVDIFRGNDEVEWRCEEHKRMAEVPK